MRCSNRPALIITQFHARCSLYYCPYNNSTINQWRSSFYVLRIGRASFHVLRIGRSRHCTAGDRATLTGSVLFLLFPQ